MTHCIGQVVRIQTTADQSVRIVVDIPRESAPKDIISWVDQMVIVSQSGTIKTEN